VAAVRLVEKSAAAGVLHTHREIALSSALSLVYLQQRAAKLWRALRYQTLSAVLV